MPCVPVAKNADPPPNAKGGPYETQPKCLESIGTPGGCPCCTPGSASGDCQPLIPDVYYWECKRSSCDPDLPYGCETILSGTFETEAEANAKVIELENSPPCDLGIHGARSYLCGTWHLTTKTCCAGSCIDTFPCPKTPCNPADYSDCWHIPANGKGPNGETVSDPIPCNGNECNPCYFSCYDSNGECDSGNIV